MAEWRVLFCTSHADGAVALGTGNNTTVEGFISIHGNDHPGNGEFNVLDIRFSNGTDALIFGDKTSELLSTAPRAGLESYYHRNYPNPESR